MTSGTLSFCNAGAQRKHPARIAQTLAEHPFGFAVSLVAARLRPSLMVELISLGTLTTVPSDSVIVTADDGAGGALGCYIFGRGIAAGTGFAYTLAHLGRNRGAWQWLCCGCDRAGQQGRT